MSTMYLFHKASGKLKLSLNFLVKYYKFIDIQSNLP